MGATNVPNCGEVYPALWVGETPVDGRWLLRSGFDALILCAREIQPPDTLYPGVHVVRCPIDDDELGPRDVARIGRTAYDLAWRLGLGQQALSACHMGLNRSALVAGLAMVKLGVRPKDAVDAIRRVRGPWALSNRHFERMILGH